MTASNPNFRLGQAYATRSYTGTETLYWFIPITNVGSSLQCFIEVTNLEFKDSTGQTLVTNDFTFASGSVGTDLASGFYTDTCLSAGETGYLFGIELDDDTPSIYSLVSAINISSLSSEAGFELPPAQVSPQSYAVANGDELSVTVQNEGPEAVRAGDFSHYFLLDDSGFPLNWGYFENGFDSNDDNPVIAAGQTYTLVDPFLLYDGLANKIQVQVDFTSPSESSPFHSGVNTDTEARQKQYAAHRNGLEKAKQLKLEQLEPSR